MAYVKQTWVNLPSTTTPLSATRLTYIENGIYNLDQETLKKSSNLAELTSDSEARTNPGLGSSATLNVGTEPGTVAAGDHTHADFVRNVAYWDENTSDWPSRPAVGSGIHVEWRSVTDPLALPPSEAIPGDSWKRAPGSTTP